MRYHALAAAGMDVDETLGRVLGNERLLERLLTVYREDTSCADLARALDAGDVDAARAAAHALKGVSLNLAVAPLAEGATQMLALLHAGDLAQARSLLPAIERAQEAFLRACRE